jgi:hypothetical protein
MSLKLNAPVSPHELAWWNTNIRGVFPPDVGLDFARMEVGKPNSSVLFFELMGAGLNKTQAEVVANEGLAGLHTITAAGGTGFTTPVTQDVFLNVVNILTAKGDDSVQRERAGAEHQSCSG